MNMMTKSLIMFFMVVAVVFQSLQCFAVKVKGYYRKNGTYVSSYERAAPSSRSKRLSSGNSSSYSSYSTTRQGASSFVVPKSYEVYKQRQTQGPRAFSKGMKKQKYHEQGGTCNHCGTQGSMSDMEADHVVPYSKGGKTEYSNLQILCRPCNRSKGNRSSQ